MASEYVKAFQAFLSEHNITDYHFEQGGRHPRLVVRYNGTSYIKAFSGSGSDWRGPANAVSQLRHQLGLLQNNTSAKSTSRQRTKPPRTKNHSVLPTPTHEPTPVTVDKFYAPLQVLKARLEAAKAANDNGTPEPAPMSAVLPAAPARPAELPRLTPIRTPWLGLRLRYSYQANDDHGYERCAS